MPRRYQSYPPEFQIWHVLSSAGASILAVGYALPLFYFAWSILRGPRASANPWGATGLEWSTRSPPPPENFTTTPTVIRPPYQYDGGKPCMQAGDV
jgi:cytochrome c oxidase subunit 1